VERLRAGGATVEAVRLAVDFREILDRHLQIMAVDAAAYHRRSFAEHRSSYGPMIAGLLDGGLKTSAVDYAESLTHLHATRREASRWLGSFDALLVPSTDTTAPARLDTTGPRDFQAPWSYAGLPVVSIPCGLCADGMPAALQLVGRRNHEATMLATARWCEERFGFNACPPWEE
jgi:aspartyl-tRNA(Asn)/glutamyl-tRNA(Gln) amidotransferase subunit A